MPGAVRNVKLGRKRRVATTAPRVLLGRREALGDRGGRVAAGARILRVFWCAVPKLFGRINVFYTFSLELSPLYGHSQLSSSLLLLTPTMSSTDLPVVCHCGADVPYDDDEPSIYCSVACARLDSLNKLNAKSPGARRSASSSVSSSLSFSTSSAASSMSSQTVDTPRHSSEVEDLPTFLTSSGENDTLDEGFDFEMVTHAHSQRSPTLPGPVSHYEACYAREVALKGASGASGLFSNASLSPPAPAPVPVASTSTSASPARPTLRRVRKPLQKSAPCSSSDDESDFDYEDRSRTPRSWGHTNADARSDAVSTPLPASPVTCTAPDIFQITQSIVTRDPEASGAYAYAFPPGLGLGEYSDADADELSTASGFTTDAEESEFDERDAGEDEDVVIQLVSPAAAALTAPPIARR